MHVAITPMITESGTLTRLGVMLTKWLCSMITFYKGAWLTHEVQEAGVVSGYRACTAEPG